MAIYQQLVNFDTEFNQLRDAPIIINDLLNNSEQDKELIKENESLARMVVLKVLRHVADFYILRKYFAELLTSL